MYVNFGGLMVGVLEGPAKGMPPGAHPDGNLYDMAPEKLAKIKHAPASLGEALDALEQDQDFLLAGGVFSKALLENYIAGKRTEAADEAKRPTASEFFRYYDV